MAKYVIVFQFFIVITFRIGKSLGSPGRGNFQFFIVITSLKD